jgi:hypothetical protein
MDILQRIREDYQRFPKILATNFMPQMFTSKTP